MVDTSGNVVDGFVWILCLCVVLGKGSKDPCLVTFLLVGCFVC